MSTEARERRHKASVLGIEGTAWNIGHAVRFLPSEHARYITSQILNERFRGERPDDLDSW
jgi:hypothetical protein